MEMSIREKGFSLVLTIMQCAISLSLSMLLYAYQINYCLPVEGIRAIERGRGQIGAGRLSKVGRPVRRRKVATMLYAN